MPSKLTVKGQITIPKKVREALQAAPGDELEFKVNEKGEVLVARAIPPPAPDPDRFERAVGTATIKWRTDELMALLRPYD